MLQAVARLKTKPSCSALSHSSNHFQRASAINCQSFTNCMSSSMIEKRSELQAMKKKNIVSGQRYILFLSRQAMERLGPARVQTGASMLHVKPNGYLNNLIHGQLFTFCW